MNAIILKGCVEKKTWTRLMTTCYTIGDLSWTEKIPIICKKLPDTRTRRIIKNRIDVQLTLVTIYHSGHIIRYSIILIYLPNITSN